MLYARQFGWLHATPESLKPRKVAAQKDRQRERELSRADRMKKDGRQPLLPEVGEVAYLVTYWIDAGLVSPGFTGPVAISALELDAWSTRTCVSLDPWEFTTLRQMSRAYIGEMREAVDEDRPPPYRAPVYEIDREVVAKKVADAFKALRSPKRNTP